jgi:hypothetical protein
MKLKINIFVKFIFIFSTLTNGYSNTSYYKDIYSSILLNCTKQQQDLTWYYEDTPVTLFYRNKYILYDDSKSIYLNITNLTLEDQGFGKYYARRNSNQKDCDFDIFLNDPSTHIGSFTVESHQPQNLSSNYKQTIFPNIFLSNQSIEFSYVYKFQALNIKSLSVFIPTRVEILSEKNTACSSDCLVQERNIRIKLPVITETCPTTSLLLTLSYKLQNEFQTNLLAFNYTINIVCKFYD